MGFDVGQRTYRLLFEDTNMEGAEVVIKATPVGVLRQLQSAENDNEYFELMEKYIISWNLDFNGEPIKIAADDMADKLETVYAVAIVGQWILAARGVTAPLDPPSRDGEMSAEELTLPMEALSENPPS